MSENELKAHLLEGLWQLYRDIHIVNGYSEHLGRNPKGEYTQHSIKALKLEYVDKSIAVLEESNL